VVDSRQPLGEPLVQDTREITSTIHPLEENQQLVFAPPQAQRVSVPVTADTRSVPATGDQQEPERVVSLLRSRIRLDKETGYQVVSAVSDASADKLRADTTDYPGLDFRALFAVAESIRKGARTGRGHSCQA
jgi:hypothetical protein